MNVRKFLPAIDDLDGLVARGAIDAAAAELLRSAVWAGRSIVVSGATHTGKTTLLGALLAACRPEQRIVTVEETFELAVDAPDIVSLQGRQPSLEGTGEVSLRRLIREALRMRPDRLVVGEVRDAEALDLLLALNTGIPGAATVHANSARDALVRLCALPLLAGRNIDASFVQPAVASSVHLVVHCVLDADGRRRVAEIIAPTGRIIDGEIVAETLYSSDVVEALPAPDPGRVPGCDPEGVPGRVPAPWPGAAVESAPDAHTLPEMHPPSDAARLPMTDARLPVPDARLPGPGARQPATGATKGSVA